MKSGIAIQNWNFGFSGEYSRAIAECSEIIGFLMFSTSGIRPGRQAGVESPLKQSILQVIGNPAAEAWLRQVAV